MPRLHIRMLPLAMMVFCLIIIGMLFYSIAEGWNHIDSLYFTVMTLTTVGYGDMYPTTVASKLFTIVYVLVGVYLLFYALRIFTRYYLEKRRPNIKRAVVQSLEHMAQKKPQKGDVVLKVKAEKKV